MIPSIVDAGCRVLSLLHASARTQLAIAAQGPSAITAAVSLRRNRSMGPTRSRRVAAQAHDNPHPIKRPFFCEASL